MGTQALEMSHTTSRKPQNGHHKQDDSPSADGSVGKGENSLSDAAAAVADSDALQPEAKVLLDAVCFCCIGAPLFYFASFWVLFNV